jgi:hypothetical protein
MKARAAIGILAVIASASCATVAHQQQIGLPEGRITLSLARGDALIDSCRERFPGDVATACIQTRPDAADKVLRFYSKQFEHAGWKPVEGPHYFGPSKTVALAPPGSITDVQRACITYYPWSPPSGEMWMVDITLSFLPEACDPIID